MARVPVRPQYLLALIAQCLFRPNVFSAQRLFGLSCSSVNVRLENSVVEVANVSLQCQSFLHIFAIDLAFTVVLLPTSTPRYISSSNLATVSLTIHPTSQPTLSGMLVPSAS
jgi:hypothetical protein